MKNSILFMLRLVASAVGGAQPPKAGADINWELIYDVAKRHSIVNIVAYSLDSIDYPLSNELRKKFDKKLYEQLFVSENQNYEVERLVLAFEEAGISYMPLKGLVLQNLYPMRDMRSMVDADILIKREEYEKVVLVMDELGFSFSGESDHEYNYIKEPFIHIELHKYLIPSYNEDMYAYFGDGWKIAKKCDDTNGKYQFSTEDNFIYILSHFAKHYRDGGIGIRHVVDLWLLCKKHSMDKDYLEEKLKELNIYEFYKNVIRLVNVWFEGAEFDEVTMNMTVYIINSGNFGTIKNSVSAETIRQNKSVEDAVKFKYIKFIFPAPDKMKKIFPILEKIPMLLPVMWIWRVLRLVLFRREKISKHKNMVENVGQRDIEEYSIHMKAVGLDIYNGRRSL